MCLSYEYFTDVSIVLSTPFQQHSVTLLYVLKRWVKRQPPNTKKWHQSCLDHLRAFPCYFRWHFGQTAKQKHSSHKSFSEITIIVGSFLSHCQLLFVNDLSAFNFVFSIWKAFLWIRWLTWLLKKYSLLLESLGLLAQYIMLHYPSALRRKHMT